MTPIRTLLVEDDAAHARLIAERLRSSTEVVVSGTAESLATACEQLRGRSGVHAFDVALLDLGLPDSEGLETIRGLHLAAPRLPIVVLSGQRDLELAVEAMRYGAQDYVLKANGDAAQLTRALRLAMERKRLQDVEQLLVGVVSHDLRAPLQTIMLACDVMLSEAHPPRHAATIRRAAARATSLVNDLLDATRARLAGVLSIECAQIDLAALVEQIVEDSRIAHPERSIQLEVGDRPQVTCDSKRIAQVVQNLLGNALQHGPAAAPVEIALRVDGDHVELAFHNGGSGIPEELRAHMFEPLERSEHARDPGHSIGLGLYIVNEIVRAHDGLIDLDSTDEAGTTFRVRLPAG